MTETTRPVTVDGPGRARAAGTTEGASTATPVRRRRKAAVPDVPLGSLSQPQVSVAGPLTCVDCSSLSLTRLTVANPVGVPAVFVSCHDCERSGWFAVDGGHEVSREAVLSPAAAEPDGTPAT